MNNTITYKGFTSRVKYSADDGIFVGRVTGVEDIIAFEGSTIDELKKEMEKMIEFHLEVCKKRGVKP